MKMVTDTMIGYKLIPHEEKLRKKPTKVTITILKATLKVTRSIMLKSFFFGNRKAVVVYPGKKNIKGRLSMTRKKLDGKKAIIRISNIDSKIIGISSI